MHHAALEEHELARSDLDRRRVAELHQAAAREGVEVFVAAGVRVRRRRPVDAEDAGARGLLIGEAASTKDQDAIADAIRNSPRTVSLINLRTEHIGPETILVAAKVQFDQTLAMNELADVIDDTEARIRKVVPSATRIFLEPDIVRDQAGIRITGD